MVLTSFLPFADNIKCLKPLAVHLGCDNVWDGERVFNVYFWPEK
jgi:hypothetical protein